MIPGEAVETVVSDEAFKAASDTYMEVLTDLRLKEGGGFKVASQNRRALRAALEAAAPHMLAGALAQIDAGEQSIPSNPLANTGLSDAVTWSEVREWLSNL